MNALKRHPVLAAAGLIVLVLLAGLLTRRQPLLIEYHHRAMVNAWRDEIDASHNNAFSAIASCGRNLKIYRHREALVSLGYYLKRDFGLRPRIVDLSLIHAVAAEARQEPVAIFQYAAPSSPTQMVVGLTVYAPPEDMPRWERFVAELQLGSTPNAESGRRE